MRLETGWYSKDEYIVVKPLHNKCRQSLVMGVISRGRGRWDVYVGVFSSYTTYKSMNYSNVWVNPTSTNKSPSMKVITLALEALNEIEQEIHYNACGKRAFIYVDGLDERRLRVYTKILTKRCGYKISTAKSEHDINLPMLYKRV